VTAADPGERVELERIIEALERPEAYPHERADFEVHQTHISVVFLAGGFAYKLKKPVDFGFLDFTTLEGRLHFCREEVRLNRRLARNVYLGVVPVVPVVPELGGSTPMGSASDALRFATERMDSELEDAVEYAVAMRRLPEDATLLSRLSRGERGRTAITTLGARIAGFHADADRGPEISRWGRFETVAGNAHENIEQATAHIGLTLSATLHRRLAASWSTSCQRSGRSSRRARKQAFLATRTAISTLITSTCSLSVIRPKTS